MFICDSRILIVCSRRASTWKSVKAFMHGNFSTAVLSNLWVGVVLLQVEDVLPAAGAAAAGVNGSQVDSAAPAKAKKVSMRYGA